MRHRLLVLAPLVLATAPAPSAQCVDRVVPEVASPGDVVVIEGSGLAGTLTVDFSAAVGGFVGFLTVSVAPLSATSTLVVAQCPPIGAFAPPDVTPPGSPFGAVGLTPCDQDGVDFYFAEGSNGAVATLGLGSSQAQGAGRAVISFALKGGAPASPNPSFAALLQRARAGSPAVLVLGAPADATPLVPFGDGTLALDLSAPLVFFTGFAADAGEALALLPIPAGLGGSAALQWVVADPTTLALSISNGLVATF